MRRIWQIGAKGVSSQRMKAAAILFLTLAFLLPAVQAAPDHPKPLYIVNGQPMEDLSAIEPEEIESIEELPADEETIARYGEAGANGVILVTLRYDQPARFEAGEGASFDQYIARSIRWEENDPTARIVLRYTVTAEGRAVVGTTLESTDSRLKRRVLKALAEAPAWEPAQKNGAPVACEKVLRIQLPEGRPMPRRVELVWR